MSIEEAKIWTNIDLDYFLNNPEVNEKRKVLYENYTNRTIFNITKDIAIDINRREDANTGCATEVRIPGYSRATRIPLVCKIGNTPIILKLVRTSADVDKAFVQLKRIVDLIKEQRDVDEIKVAVLILSDKLSTDTCSYLNELAMKYDACVSTLKYFRNQLINSSNIDFLTKEGFVYDSDN